MAKQPKTFQVFPDTKIPVSRKLGSLWKNRRDEANRVREKKNIPAWEEAIRYYNHNQAGKERTGPGYDSSSDASLGGRAQDYTENVIFATVNSLVPHVYMKNPQVEVSALKANDEEMARFATICERLVNLLGARKAAPGFNYKPKAKRGVVMAALCNAGWIEVGYTRKQDSSEQALLDLEAASKKYSEAKDSKQIQEAEGELEALEEKVALLRPSGPWAKYRSPFQVIVDQSSEDSDASDANWMMIWEYVRTSYIQAVYATKVPGSDDFKSIYKPTHLLNPNQGSTEQDEIDNYSILGETRPFEEYGYSSEDEFGQAQFTKVWYVWDLTTRRVLMYHDKDWSWPIWVWDDPLKLDTFFPLEPLSLYTNPVPGASRGEVSYYLDQQDEINVINSEKKKARTWVRRNIVYNKNLINQDAANTLVKGPDGTATGVDVPADTDLQKAIVGLKPPSMEFPELFDKSDEYQQIDRISAINDILRGAQFKTNTTNQAIDTYSSVQSSRLDEQTDAVEDQTGGVYWKILQLCLQHMDEETVVSLIGEEARGVWRNMTPQEIATSLSLNVVGGSSIKPTSQVKKSQALDVGQVLGQFAAATPMAALVMLKVFERAFDEIVITEEDWRMIREGIQQQQVAQQEGGGPPAQEGAPGTQPATQEGQASPEETIEQAAAIVDQLPEAAKRALGEAIAQGVPLLDAIEEIVAQIQQAQAA